MPMPLRARDERPVAQVTGDVWLPEDGDPPRQLQVGLPGLLLLHFPYLLFPFQSELTWSPWEHPSGQASQRAFYLVTRDPSGPHPAPCREPRLLGIQCGLPSPQIY